MCYIFVPPLAVSGAPLACIELHSCSVNAAAQTMAAACASAYQRHMCAQDEEEDEEAQLRGLKGLKVKHTADELQEGETMILTLADKNILDDKGDLDDDEDQDELENVLAVRLKQQCALGSAIIAPTSNCTEPQYVHMFQAIKFCKSVLGTAINIKEERVFWQHHHVSLTAINYHGLLCMPYRCRQGMRVCV